LSYLRRNGIPFGLASASIKSNIDFFYETFDLGRWFRKEDIVYDDGTYSDKGAMHMEAARRLNVDLRDCLLTEDSPGSITHAKRLGAGCIVAVGESAAPAKLLELGADFYIRDFSEFDYTWLQR
jgi:beta-phosphoglucomutase-like phosphatase (HAD superfamily)